MPDNTVPNTTVQTDKEQGGESFGRGVLIFLAG